MNDKIRDPYVDEIIRLKQHLNTVRDLMQNMTHDNEHPVMNDPTGFNEKVAFYRGTTWI